MPRVTIKGQVTIPKDIRNRFGFLPGMEVEVIAEGNRVVLVKSRRENKFMKWLGRGVHQDKQGIDLVVDKLRGRTDE